jgi:hypothetical protein
MPNNKDKVDTSNLNPKPAPAVSEPRTAPAPVHPNVINSQIGEGRAPATPERKT